MTGGASGAPPPFPPLGDLEEAAHRTLPEAVWDYVQGGAGAERTVAANLAAIERLRLRPRVLSDISVIDPTTRLLGRPVAAPFFVAPTAYHGAIHPDAEPGTARAAAGAGLLAVFSTLSTRSLEEIAVASGTGPRWFQLYLQPERSVTDRLVERAERAGYSALVLTVDAPVLGARDRQMRTGFAWQVPAPIGNGPDVVSPARGPTPDGPRFRFRSETAATWRLVEELGSTTRLPLVIKGLLTREDARAAVRHGAAAVVVSNHGGRQLDGASTGPDALPEVVDEVGTEVEVYVDGGFRRGSDVLAGLALGARAVGIGRPVLWALAVGGGDGVARALGMLREEVALALALTGRRSVAEIDRSLLEAPVRRRDGRSRARPRAAPRRRARRRGHR